MLSFVHGPLNTTQRSFEAHDLIQSYQQFREEKLVVQASRRIHKCWDCGLRDKEKVDKELENTRDKSGLW